MAILIWLSVFSVSFFGFQVFLQNSRILLNKLVPVDFSQSLFASQFYQCLRLVTSALSIEAVLSKVQKLKSEDKISDRIYLLLLVWALVGQVLPIVLIGLLLINVSASIFGIIGIALWILSRFVKPVENRALMFLGWSIFSWGFDQVLRQSAILMSAALDQPWIFWLGDSSLESCLILFLAGALLAFLVRLPYFAFIAAAALLLSGVISLPSAMAFVLGELLFWLLYFAWQAPNAADRKALFLRASTWGVLSLVYFYVFPLAQNILNSGFGEEYSGTLRYHQLFVGFGSWILLDLILASLIFHYFSLNRTSSKNNFAA